MRVTDAPEQPSEASAESPHAAAHKHPQAQPAPESLAPEPTAAIVEQPPSAPSSAGPLEAACAQPRTHGAGKAPEPRVARPASAGPRELPAAGGPAPGDARPAAGDARPATDSQPPAAEVREPQPEEPHERPADEVAAVLTSALDRLGAAHHRPFSRS